MKNFIFFIFHQIGSKYLHFEKFAVNFGFLAPSPLFLGFSKFGCFTKMAQNTLLLRYLRLRFGFWPLAPNFLGYHLKNVKFPILTKKTKVFKYLGLIFFGFSPILFFSQLFRISPKNFQISDFNQKTLAIL